MLMVIFPIQAKSTSWTPVNIINTPLSKCVSRNLLRELLNVLLLKQFVVVNILRVIKSLTFMVQ
eukprot:Pgem_evm2s20064